MPTQTRISSIDLLRGIVMIIMALDHTRDFFHVYANTDNPLNLDTTSPALFFTRWITHICAPVFVFLSGTSAYFQGLRKTKKQLSIFLLKRGLWLILVEVLIITLGITFNIGYNIIILQVIWAIGISMVLLSLVIWLPFRFILALGLIIVLGHNSLDFWEAGKNNFPVLYNFLHKQGTFSINENTTVFIFYPFLPWAGVMMLGYCFGRYYLADIMNRNKRTIVLGAGLILLFVILRMINIYGDPLHWSVQKSALFTFFSFINTQKYPPSLLYLCITIGPSLLLLGLLGDVNNKLTNALTVYGRVPLFYYVLHFYLIHILSAIAFLSRGHTFAEGLEGVEGFPFRFLIPGEGYSLGFVYLVWLFVVIALYPLCKWFSDYKIRHKKWWLSYL
jgi:uncharacterized membrane protein